jgi:hypothetical protein
VCAVGKVTGGGEVVPDAGGLASFGFVAQRQTFGGPSTGHFNYVNHSTGLHVNGPVNLLIIYSATSAAFHGSGLCNANPCTFEVTVEDNYDPGRGKDKISIKVMPNSPAEIMAPKTIIRGNIQVHKPPNTS